MTYAPTNPVDVPPYQIQPLIASVLAGYGHETPSRLSGAPATHVRCAQALGSEIYVGCSNGELLRFALQADNPNTPESYQLLSRQSLPSEKPIEEIAVLPSISRALILCDHQIHLYTLPSLDPVPPNVIKPIRNVVTFAVEDQHLRRPPPSDASHPMEPVEFCVIKRSSIALYSLRERLLFQKEIPFQPGVLLARRSGRYLCVLVAEDKTYAVIDLQTASLLPLLPLSQAPSVKASDPPIKPFIVVVGENEFLILSWTGASTLGVFITGEGDPVRGTLEWPSHPLAVCLDYPYITTLLPNRTIEIHNSETQSIVQVISAPAWSPPASPLPSPSAARFSDRHSLVACVNRYFVPSTERSEKLRITPVRLLRGSVSIETDSRTVAKNQDQEGHGDGPADGVAESEQSSA